jgi:PAS domain S-box-containing protein
MLRAFQGEEIDDLMDADKARFRSLRAKLVAIYVPMVAISILILFAVLEFRFYYSERDKLIEGLSNLISTQAPAFAAATWEFDTNRIDELLKGLEDLPMFQGGVVRDPSGQVLGKTGDIETAPENPAFSASRPLKFTTNNSSEIAGNLTIIVHSGKIWKDVRDHIGTNAIILLILVGVIIVVTIVAIDRVVGIPLTHLRQAMENAKTSKTHKALEWDSADELGQVVRAYNNMQEAQANAEKDLFEHQLHLEEMVAERTAELGEREQRIRTLLEVSPIGFALVRRDGKALMGNDSLFRIFGFTQEQFLSQGVSGSYQDIADRERFLEAIERDGMVTGMEVLMQRADGTDVWVNVNSKLIEYGGDEVILSWCSDITERKHVEEEFHQSVEQFRGVFEASAAGMALLSMEGTYFKVNQRFCDIVGYSEAEMMSMNWRDLTLAEDIPAIEALDSRVEQGDLGEFFAERRLVRKDGKVIWTSLSSAQLRDRDNKPQHIYSFIQDISELKEAEQAVRESEAKLRELLDSGPIGIGVVDQETGERLFVNQHFVRMMGAKSAAHLRSESLKDSYVDKNDVKLIRETINSVGTIENVEVQRRRLDGSTFWALQSSQALDGFQGRPARVVWLVDVSDLKDAETNLQNLKNIGDTVLDNMGQGISMFDENLNVTAFNPTLLKMLDLPDDLAVGDPFEKWIRYTAERGEYGPGDIEKQVRLRVDLAKTFEPHRFERTTADGRVIEIKGQPVKSGGFVSTYTDITERKKAAAELAEKEKQLSYAIDNMPSGIIMIDEHMNIQMFNELYRQLYEMPEGVLKIGGSLKDMIRERATRGDYGPGDPEEQISSRVAGYDNTRQVAENRVPSGKTLELVRNPTEDGGLVAVCSDITERKIAEARLQDAYDVISSSVQYATRIQRSVLPDDAFLQNLFEEYFVIWEPRDQVGGDIYWCRKWGYGNLVMLGDCTGHGIPGAFMTLIATGALDRALVEIPPGQVGRLIQRMHQYVQATLGQDTEGGRSDEGLELGACYFESDNTEMTYSGARFSLFVVENGEIEEIKGDKKGIGYRNISQDQKFTDISIEMEDGQTFYLTTDGMIDQVGGEKRRGFGKKRFRKLILSVQDMSLTEQKFEIFEALHEHQGNELRRDDVSIFGFRVTED